MLRGFNPWWTTGRIPDPFLKKLKRTPYFEVEKILDVAGLKRAIVLSGPRRVGKTTILYQIANSAIHERRINSSQVLYLTLEHPVLKLMPIDEILNIYDREIAPAGQEKWVLLDELQYIDEPTKWLKILVDQHPDWKIIVTGSASIVFRSKDKESGVGRWVTVLVPPLSFYEYIALRHEERNNVTPPEIPELVNPLNLGALDSANRQQLLSRLKPLKREFDTYLLQGGFPDTALQEDLSLAQRLLREDIVDKVLKRDMAAFYGVRKLQELERLFVYLCIHNGEVVNEKTISNELNISRPTVSSLLRNLEGAHLIRPLSGLSLTGKKALKGRVKWYLADPSIRNAVLLRGTEMLNDPRDLGMVVESVVINQLATYSYPTRPRLGYWKDRKGREVDLIIDTPTKKRVAVEVKYRENPRIGSDDGITRYLESDSEAQGIVVTKDAEDFETKVVTGERSVTLIPAYVFLYILGHFERRRHTKS